MINKQINLYDNSSPKLAEQYNKDNYTIRDVNPDSDLVVVYFSSNGLYYPNTEEEFTKVVIDGNRYEWQHYKIYNCRREIYLRDIRKSWYLRGINSRIDSIGKLCDFIKEQIPEGCRIVTVGNSAGGYAAALFGTLLGADCVYDFSGQMALRLERQNRIVNDRFLKKEERCIASVIVDIGMDIMYEDILDLNSLWDKVAIPKIFYFYSAKAEQDMAQWMTVDATKQEQINSFAFDTSTHEETMYNFNLTKVLNMDTNTLVCASKRYKGKYISRLGFSVSVCGLWWTIGQLLRKMRDWG